MSLRFLLVCAVISTSLFLSAQNSSISGIINDEKGIGIPFATIILKSQKDSSMVKADITSENGKFLLEMIPQGLYFTESSYIGLTTHVSTVFELGKSPFIHPPVSLMADAKQLDEVLVTAQRALIEVKPDRTVFNVQGTINSAGENGLNILRKAPVCSLTIIITSQSWVGLAFYFMWMVKEYLSGVTILPITYRIFLPSK
ncbi:MAG: hypothetical protein IPP49_15700 [Saprospiraceae bacterium]|nr:hypothetical protein [Saprospiraceae bacterium]